MNALVRIVVCFLICLCASFVSAETAAPHPDLAAASWSLTQAPRLNAESKDTIWRFINNSWGNSNDLNAGSGKVCEFKFADLQHSGILSLVVSYDSGGLADCNLVNIFDKTTAGIEDYDFNASVPVHLNSVQDINKDGNFEVILDKVFAVGGMHQCTATWPVIYAWNGTGYADVSEEYKGYYQKTLADLQRQINPTPAVPVPEQANSLEQDNGGKYYSVHSGIFPQEPPTAAPDSDDINCLEAETAKIKRFLGMSRDAGMSDAIKWADSNNPDDREFAASILSDIGTGEAIGYLRTLSNDPEHNVARSGRELMKNPAGRSNLSPTIQGELLTPDTGASSPK